MKYVFFALALSLNAFQYIENHKLRGSYKTLENRYLRAIRFSSDRYKFATETYEKFKKYQNKIDWYKKQNQILEYNLRKTGTKEYRNYLTKLNKQRLNLFTNHSNYVLKLNYGSRDEFSRVGSTFWRDVPFNSRSKRN